MIKSINLSFNTEDSLHTRLVNTFDFYANLRVWYGSPVSFEFKDATVVFTENFLDKYSWKENPTFDQVKETVLKAVEEGNTYVLFE